jgi:hypothetical protein
MSVRAKGLAMEIEPFKTWSSPVGETCQCNAGESLDKLDLPANVAEEAR